VKVVFAAFKFDYGKETRGESLEQRAFYPALKSNFETVIPFWLEENGFPDDIPSLQEKLVQFVYNEKPDFVFFILMDSEIFPDTLLKIKNKSSTINWFCDDAWRFKNYTSNIAKYFTYCITVDKYSISQYEECGINNVILSQWAAFDYADNIDFTTLKYTHEVSFIGSKSPTREWIISYLKKNNIHVECFGSGWENGKISYEEIKKILLESKINLNLSNSVSADIKFLNYLIGQLALAILKVVFTKPSISIKKIKFYMGSIKYYFFGKKRVETIKARNFEISGCGGFQLSQFALEIEDYFQIGREISIFSNLDELKRQIIYYLKFSEEREKIRNNGYNRCIEHTYDIRIRNILNSLILNKK
jgi:spore maturation protein CgeB